MLTDSFYRSLAAVFRGETIAADRLFMVADPPQGVESGYDFCAFCFGRERSRR